MPDVAGTVTYVFRVSVEGARAIQEAKELAQQLRNHMDITSADYPGWIEFAQSIGKLTKNIQGLGAAISAHGGKSPERLFKVSAATISGLKEAATVTDRVVNTLGKQTKAVREIGEAANEAFENLQALVDSYKGAFTIIADDAGTAVEAWKSVYVEAERYRKKLQEVLELSKQVGGLQKAGAEPTTPHRGKPRAMPPPVEPDIEAFQRAAEATGNFSRQIQSLVQIHPRLNMILEAFRTQLGENEEGLITTSNLIEFLHEEIARLASDPLIQAVGPLLQGIFVLPGGHVSGVRGQAISGIWSPILRSIGLFVELEDVLDRQNTQARLATTLAHELAHAFNFLAKNTADGERAVSGFKASLAKVVEEMLLTDAAVYSTANSVKALTTIWLDSAKFTRLVSEVLAEYYALLASGVGLEKASGAQQAFISLIMKAARNVGLASQEVNWYDVMLKTLSQTTDKLLADLSALQPQLGAVAIGFDKARVSAEEFLETLIRTGGVKVSGLLRAGPEVAGLLPAPQIRATPPPIQPQIEGATGALDAYSAALEQASLKVMKLISVHAGFYEDVQRPYFGLGISAGEAAEKLSLLTAQLSKIVAESSLVAEALERVKAIEIRPYLGEDEVRKAVGLWDGLTRTLTLLPGAFQIPGQLLVTMFHELGHALVDAKQGAEETASAWQNFELVVGDIAAEIAELGDYLGRANTDLGSLAESLSVVPFFRVYEQGAGWLADELAADLFGISQGYREVTVEMARLSGESVAYLGGLIRVLRELEGISGSTWDAESVRLQKVIDAYNLLIATLLRLRQPLLELRAMPPPTLPAVQPIEIAAPTGGALVPVFAELIAEIKPDVIKAAVTQLLSFASSLRVTTSGALSTQAAMETLASYSLGTASVIGKLATSFGATSGEIGKFGDLIGALGLLVSESARHIVGAGQSILQLMGGRTRVAGALGAGGVGGGLGAVVVPSSAAPEAAAAQVAPWMALLSQWYSSWMPYSQQVTQLLSSIQQQLQVRAPEAGEAEGTPGTLDTLVSQWQQSWASHSQQLIQILTSEVELKKQLMSGIAQWAQAWANWAQQSLAAFQQGAPGQPPPPPTPPGAGAGGAAAPLPVPPKGQIDFYKRLSEAINEATLRYFGLRRLGYAFAVTGESISRSFRGALDAIISTVKVYDDFASAVGKAAGTLALSVEQQELFGQAMIRTAAAVAAFSPAELAEGVRIWVAGTGQAIRTSEDLNEVLAATVAIQKAAAINQESLGTIMESVGGIMTEFGMSLDDVNHIVETLSILAAQTFATVSDLGEAMKFVGPVARTVGVSFDETATAIAMLADANIRGSMAGRALRQTFLGISSPTKEAEAVMNKMVVATGNLGKSWRELIFPEGKFIGLARYIEFLAAATANLTEEQRLQQLETIATANEVAGLAALVGEQIEAQERGFNVMETRRKLMLGLIDDEVEAMLKWRKETGRAQIEVMSGQEMLQEQWKAYTESTAYQTAVLERQMERITLAVGKSVRRLIVDVGDVFAGFLDTVADVAEKIPFVFNAALVAAGFGTAFGGLIKMVGDAFVMASSVLMTRSIYKAVLETGGPEMQAVANAAGHRIGTAFGTAAKVGIIGVGIAAAVVAAWQVGKKIDELAQEDAERYVEGVRGVLAQPEGIREAVAEQFYTGGIQAAKDAPGIWGTIVKVLASTPIGWIAEQAQTIGANFGLNFGIGLNRTLMRPTEEARRLLLEGLVPEVNLGPLRQKTLEWTGSVELTTEEVWRLTNAVRSLQGEAEVTFEQFLSGQNDVSETLVNYLGLEGEVREALYNRIDILQILETYQRLQGKGAQQQLAQLISDLLVTGELTEQGTRLIGAMWTAIKEKEGPEAAENFRLIILQLAQAIGWELPSAFDSAVQGLRFFAAGIDETGLSIAQMFRHFAVSPEFVKGVEEAQREAQAQLIQATDEYNEQVEDAERKHSEDLLKLWQDTQERRLEIVRKAIEQRQAENQRYREQEKEAEEDYARSIEKAYRDFGRSEARAREDYQQSIADAIRDFQRSEAQSEIEHQETLQDARDDAEKERQKAAEDHAERNAKIWEDYHNKVADIHESHQEKLADINKQAQKREADSFKRHQERLDELAEELIKAREDAVTEQEKRIAEIYEDNDERKEKAREDHLKRLADLERDYGRSLRQIVRRRDAVALLEERERYRERQEDAARAYAEAQKELDERLQEALADADEKYQEQLADIEARHQERIADLQRDLQRQLAEIEESRLEAIAEAQEDLTKRLIEAGEARDEALREELERYDKQREEINKRLEERLLDLEENYQKQRERAKAAFELRLQDMEEQFQRQRARAKADFETRLADMQAEFELQRQEREKEHQKRLIEIEKEKQEELDKEMATWRKRADELNKELGRQYTTFKDTLARKNQEIYDNFRITILKLGADLADKIGWLEAYFDQLKTEGIDVRTEVQLTTVTGADLTAWLQENLDPSVIRYLNTEAVPGPALANLIDIFTRQEPITVDVETFVTEVIGLQKQVDAAAEKVKPTIGFEPDFNEAALKNTLKVIQDTTKVDLYFTAEPGTLIDAANSSVITVQGMIDSGYIPGLKIKPDINEYAMEGAIVRAAQVGQIFADEHVRLRIPPVLRDDQLESEAIRVRNAAQHWMDRQPPILIRAVIQEPTKRKSPSLVDTLIETHREIFRRALDLEPIEIPAVVALNGHDGFDPRYMAAASRSSRDGRLGDINVTVTQRDWHFNGSLTDAERREFRRMAKESAYEGIREVVTEVARR